MSGDGASALHSTQAPVASAPIARGNGLDVAAIEFRSRELDETRAFIKARYGDHTRVAHGRDPFRFELRAMASSRVVVGLTRVGSPQTVRAAVHSPTLFLPDESGTRINVGRKAFEYEPGTAILMAPGHEYSALHCRPTVSLGLRVDGDLLQEQIAARLKGRTRRWLLQCVAIPLDARCQAELREAHARMTVAALNVDAWGAYGVVSSFEREVASWLAGLVIAQSGALPAAAGTVGRIDRVERWVAAHMSEDISLDRLCSVAGIGWRPLQKAFLAATGQSPLEFVTSRRLAAVRARLARAAKGDKVSHVAMDCGFTHLGRFSAQYRRAFGESPSETVGTARVQAQPMSRHDD